VRRDELFRAESVQAVGSMVVGVDVEDIECAGLSGKRTPSKQDRQNQPDEKPGRPDWVAVVGRLAPRKIGVH